MGRADGIGRHVSACKWDDIMPVQVIFAGRVVDPRWQPAPRCSEGVIKLSMLYGPGGSSAGHGVTATPPADMG
jgi:hypothetical protein